MLDCCVDIAIRPGHLLETGVVDNKVGSQCIEQRIEVGTLQLNWRCGKKKYRICIVTKVAHSLVEKGFRVSDVMSLIHDDQVKFGRRIEAN